MTRLIPAPDPGIYPDMPSETYHAIDCAGRSNLHKIAQGNTLAAVRYGMEHNSADSDALALGSALHMAMLEPDKYASSVQLGPINEKTGKTYGRGTQKWDAWAEDIGPDITLITSEQEEKIVPLVNALRAHPMIAGAFARIEHKELTCIATIDLPELAQNLGMPWVYGDEDTQLLTKVRLDAVTTGVIVDLKTQGAGRGRRVGPDALAWSAVDYGYYAQSGLYPLVAQAAGLPEVQHFTAAVVESEPPHLTYFVRFSEASQRAGLQSLLPAMVAMARAYRTEEWPGYPGGVIDLDPPEGWVRNLGVE